MGAYHIGLGPEHLAGNGGLGRYVFLPGDPSRAERIGARFRVTERIENPRGHHALLGVLGAGDAAVDVLSISSGMGPPSVEIVLHELLEMGARRVVRVGSAGRLTDRIPHGSVVVATGAVRDESTSDRWTPRGFPAVAHPDAVAAMCRGARDAGLADHTFAGIVHAKDSLFGREMSAGPMRAENDRYMEVLSDSGVLVTEMEASILFVMATTASAGAASPLSAGPSAVPVQTAAILAVYGETGSAETETADERAITVACAGVLAWAAEVRRAI